MEPGIHVLFGTSIALALSSTRVRSGSRVSIVVIHSGLYYDEALVLEMQINCSQPSVPILVGAAFYIFDDSNTDHLKTTFQRWGCLMSGGSLRNVILVNLSLLTT